MQIESLYCFGFTLLLLEMICFVNIHQTCLFMWQSQLAVFFSLFSLVVFSLCMVPCKIPRAQKVSEDRVTSLFVVVDRFYIVLFCHCALFA